MRKFGKKVKCLLRLVYLSNFQALIEYRHAHAGKRANVPRVIRLVRPGYQPANNDTVFTSCLINVLENNEEPCTPMEEIADRVIKLVEGKSNNYTPDYGNIRNSLPNWYEGPNTGDFIFIHR